MIVKCTQYIKIHTRADTVWVHAPPTPATPPIHVIYMHAPLPSPYAHTHVRTHARNNNNILSLFFVLPTALSTRPQMLLKSFWIVWRRRAIEWYRHQVLVRRTYGLYTKRDSTELVQSRVSLWGEFFLNWALQTKRESEVTYSLVQWNWFSDVTDACNSGASSDPIASNPGPHHFDPSARPSWRGPGKTAGHLWLFTPISG